MHIFLILLLKFIGVIILENQLIVYTPKKNVKKIILCVLLGLLISIIIFVVTVFCSALVCSQNKWDKKDYVDLKTTDLILKTQ